MSVLGGLLSRGSLSKGVSVLEGSLSRGSLSRGIFVQGGICHKAKELLRVGLHWCVPFIEDLSETVQVVW